MRVRTGRFSRPHRNGPTLGPVFAIGQPDAPPDYLGDGTTQIHCAGLLAHALHEERMWRPSRWFVAKEQRVWAARLAGGRTSC